MATAASEEEQAKEVEVVTAAPDPEQQELRERLQRLHARMSQLLGPDGGAHRVVVTGWRCLAFLEMEVSITAAFLTQHLDNDPMGLLQSGEFLLGLFDYSQHSLLRRAFECFNRWESYSYLLYPTARLYYTNEYRSRYRHLLLTSFDQGVTPQLTEAGALPLVGIDRPAKKILRFLADQGKMESDRSLRVMSIFGPVGIGKTTLAVELRSRLRQHETSVGRCYFQCNVMAQASRGPDRNILLLQYILSQVSEPAATTLSSHPSQAKTMEVLVRLVSECLRDKRYLVIIDDIWEASDWEKIKGAFPNNHLDSRILVTTRSRSIAWACCSNSYDDLVQQMKPLSKRDSEMLLLAKIVGSADGCLPNNMKLLCDEILRRCDGIPLFIIGMADWLKGQRLQKQHPREDEDVEHQRLAMYYEEQVPVLPERLEQALSSAFNNVFANNDLRFVLLYMSMFPYGYKFEKHRLILKWLHDGLTHPDSSYAESEAETFFSQLVEDSVITCVTSNCKHKQDEADACQWQVNHVLHQFFASKSAEMGYIFTTATLNLVTAASTETSRGNETSSRMPRKLALHHPDPQLPSVLQTMDLFQTRSLAVSGAVNSIPLDRFANLVVLDLEGWEILNDEHLVQVCRRRMSFLSYLSVRNTRVSKLPHEIKELRILDTLDISYTQITELPLEVFKLTLLKHLDTRGTQISQLPKQNVGLHRRLEYLLVGDEGTMNFVETATMVPESIRCLQRLHTQATVHLTEHTASSIKALGALEKLRMIAITWSFHQSTDRDYCEALWSCIGNWQSLESLTFHCGLGCSMEFLGSLEMSRAPRRIKKFKVTAGRFAGVPRWIDGLEHLAFVQITVCNNKQVADDLKILGVLPKLQYLILGLDLIPGQPIVIIGNEGFRELQRFSVDCPMPWLTFSTGAMPKLTYLQLEFCSTPGSQICVPSGISNLRRLTEVALCYNPQYVNSPSIKMTVDAVTKEVAKHRNPIDLFINGIEQDDVKEAYDEVTEIMDGTSSRTNAGSEDDGQAVGEEATAAVQCEITKVES